MAAPTGVAPIDALEVDVAAEDAVIDSAVVLINGFDARLQAGIAAALQGGATAAQMSALTDLSADVKAHASSLASAVQANTPAAPAAPAAKKK